MIKKCICFFLTSVSLVGYGNVFQEPQVIDFSRLTQEQIESYNVADWQGIERICRPFADTIEFIPYFDFLQREFHLDQAVKTGIWDYQTVTFLSIICKNVFTMEVDGERFERALKEKYYNVNVAYGHSHDMMRQYLPSFKDQRILFYLDVTENSRRPLLEELDEIAKTHRDNCVVVINGCRIPGRDDILYDSMNGRSYSYKGLKSSIEKIYSEHACYYLISNQGKKYAQLVLIPRKWM
jgi:hypothetical protein